MTQYRSYKRINITLPESLIQRIKDFQTTSTLSRSGMIEIALRDWLQHHEAAKQTRFNIERGKPITDYTRPGMSNDDFIELLKEYEAVN